MPKLRITINIKMSYYRIETLIDNYEPEADIHCLKLKIDEQTLSGDVLQSNSNYIQTCIKLTKPHKLYHIYLSPLPLL